MLRHRKVKIQLLFVLLLAIVPFLLFIFYLFDLWYDTSRTAVLSENITQSRLIAAYVKDAFEQGLNDAKILAAEPFISNLTGNPVEGRKILSEIIKNQPQIYAVNVLDAKGTLVTSTLTLSPDQTGISAVDREYFQQAVKTKRPVVSAPTLGLITKHNLIVMAAPVIKNGEATGVVTTSYDLDHLKQGIEKIMNNNEKGTVVLLDNKGKIIFTTNKPYSADDQNQSFLVGEDFVKEALNGKISTIENKPIPSLGPMPFIGASVPVADLGWVAVSLEPVNNIFAPLFSLQKIVWMIILSALIFALALISYFLRKIKIVY